MTLIELNLDEPNTGFVFTDITNKTYRWQKSLISLPKIGVENQFLATLIELNAYKECIGNEFYVIFKEENNGVTFRFKEGLYYVTERNKDSIVLLKDSKEYFISFVWA
ncbi:hypothetical protein [Mucilaginibacter flavus]|uniref:hypothetical protein n=1 Tax=Mucilaginibacter flavus TaxID=931504 RepID=UPI0025B59355|nr:hypothetical protein [Mucilaginibacter flavus]